MNQELKMVDKPRICIIIPYFGTWPDWFNYFLISCKFNPGIDWYFFSDCGALPIKCKNLILFDTTLDDFNSIASKKLQIPISIKYPYKVCDFRPAFGKIFEDYIAGYDFWGYGDIDLIYGNIKFFVTEYILSSSDIITFHDSFVPGHLCILKNSPNIVELYKNSSNWEYIFRNDKHFAFDENFVKGGEFLDSEKLAIYTKKKIFKHLIKTRLYNSHFLRILKFLKNIIIVKQKELSRNDLKDFNEVIRFFETNGKISVFRGMYYMDDIMLLRVGKKKWEILWHNGSIYERENELIYFHFQLSKFNKNFKLNDNLKFNNTFKIINH